MSRPRGFIVNINGPENLPEPTGQDHKEIGRQNGEAIVAHFHARVEQLMEEGAFDGINVENKFPRISALFIDGPQEKIDRLKAYLEEKKLGLLGENFELRMVR